MEKPIKHYTALVYLLTDSRPRKALLVHHRKFDKWVSPGGHQEAWENPVEAAVREVREETGLDVSRYFNLPKRASGHAQYIPVPQYLLEAKIPAHGNEPEHYHFDMEYVITVPEQAVTSSQAESYNIGWFTLEEVERLPTFEDILTVLRQELAK